MVLLEIITKRYNVWQFGERMNKLIFILFIILILIDLYFIKIYVIDDICCTTCNVADYECIKEYQIYLSILIAIHIIYIVSYIRSVIV